MSLVRWSKSFLKTIEEHILYNPTIYDINISCLGLRQDICGGRLIEENIKDPRTGKTLLINKHVVGPGEVLLIQKFLVKDVLAVAPQLCDAGVLLDICKKASFGWNIIPLSDLEKHLFISPASKPSDFTVELVKELKLAGYFNGA